MAFLAAQLGQASKTATAAFTLWPRALGGAAQVAPTRRFSPVSHLRREFGDPTVLSFPEERAGVFGNLGQWGLMLKNGLENPGSAAHQLCDPEQVTSNLTSLLCTQRVVIVINRGR